MSLALTERVAQVEKRSELAVLSDLENSGKDIVRLRLSRPEIEDGSVPVEQGLQFFKSARDILNAAASAALSPAAYFSTRPPRQVSDFMANARLGQTERGSYVITMEAPIAPALDDPIHSLPDPFERRVTRTLASALSALSEATITSDAQHFRDSIARGVSANLTQALASALRLCGAQGDVEFSLSFAATRPADLAPLQITFPGYLHGLLTSATDLLKENSLLANYEVFGPVHRLTDVGSGTEAILIALVEGRLRKVNVVFDNRYRETLTEAFNRHLLVKCFGELSLTSRTATLEQARQVSLVSSESEDSNLDLISQNAD